jgi:hypothetical protein
MANQCARLRILEHSSLLDEAVTSDHDFALRIIKFIHSSIRVSDEIMQTAGDIPNVVR